MDNQNQLLRVDAAHAIMLEDLRQSHFQVMILLHDHNELVSVICHPRQGHGEEISDIEGHGLDLNKAIEDAWIKWRK